MFIKEYHLYYEEFILIMDGQIFKYFFCLDDFEAYNMKFIMLFSLEKRINI